MCGITGIIQPNNHEPIDQDILKSMTSTLIHRGPDDEGYFFDHNVGLGHRRLSIIDIRHGHQPMANEDETVWIVFNGQIYNYLELRQGLIAKGHTLKTNSDTEVIIHLYEEYGVDCLKKLNGMFAFLIWDSKAKRAFIARDRIGIKPLYYYFDSSHLVIASEIKALLKHPDISAVPNWDGINDYFTFQFCLGEKTLFQGINKLLPGHFIIFDPDNPGSFHVQKYWDVNYTIDTYHTEDYFVDILTRLLEDSVRLQLRSDVAIGAHLSGGLDSSAVTCIAASLYNNMDARIQTFTGSFKEGNEYDESLYAKIVSEYASTEYHEISPTSQDFTSILPQLIYSMDEPAAGPGIFPQYYLSKLASENVKVVLGGQGGDEIFGGYARYITAYLEQCLKGAIYNTNEEGKYVVTLESIVPNLSVLQQYTPMLKNFWSEGLFDSMDRRYFKLVSRTDQRENLFSDRFMSRRNTYSAFNSFTSVFGAADTPSYINKMLYFDLKASLPALLQVEDRTSMAVSLESRVPLLDHRIVELMASVPPTIKFKSGIMKYLFKKSIKNIVPEKILNRTDKMGFPVPLNEWFSDSLKDYIRDTLIDERVKERGIYNMEGLENMITSETKFGRNIWGILCLELWFRTFIDEASPMDYLRLGKTV
jgi:asparagine synthase (glutamine-hydrolysing)